MGRPQKKGLNYFNIDCDEEEDNLAFIIAKHKAAGYGIVIRLWRRIYKYEGYFTEWNEKVAFLFSRDIGESSGLIREVIESCLQEGIFSREMFDRFSILTSRGIQNRYLKIITEAKRKGVEIDANYSLLIKIPEETPLIPEETGKNPGKSTQSKVKESKVKESKEKERVSPKGDCETDVSRAQKLEFDKIEKNKREVIDFIRKFSPQFIEPYVHAWNFFARENGLAEVLKTSDVRKRKFRARIREKGFDFISILSEAKKSPFLLEGKWFAFDWLIENESNYLKILEGNYKAKDKDEKGQIITSKISIEDLRVQFSDKIDPKLIKPEHFDDLGLSEATLENAKTFRISKLMGTNKGPELRLIQKYKNGIVDAETDADLPTLKRIAVHQYFTSLNQGA